MEADPQPLYWRVGYHSSPTDFHPWEGYEFSRRFDDARGRFRTVYCAEDPATAIREVLCDFRPNAAAIARHVERFGPEAAADIPSAPVTASWRRQSVLVRVVVKLHTATVVDLSDDDIRAEIERAHAPLLRDHNMDHLDMADVMTSRRIVTQTVAADLFDTGAGAIRFLSHIDGRPCIAILEGRGALQTAESPIVLTDPAPEPLQRVAREWGLKLEPAL